MQIIPRGRYPLHLKDRLVLFHHHGKNNEVVFGDGLDDINCGNDNDDGCAFSAPFVILFLSASISSAVA